MSNPFRALLRRRPPTVPTVAHWQRIERTLPFLAWGPPGHTQALRERAMQFLAQKEFFGADGLTLTDDILLAIALQAALPVLHLGVDAYRGWVGVIVYPGEICIAREEMDEYGIVHEYTDIVCGEAREDGPVLLGWEEDGFAPQINVIVHEFAHKLDMADGIANGCPPLPAQISRPRWAQAFAAAFADFQHRCDAIEDDEDDRAWDALPLDPYAAEHPAEFFAVASETFFIAPHRLTAAYPEVYQHLSAFYQQNPAAYAPAPCC